MSSLAGVFFAVSMVLSASAQCPASGETDANKASAATLAHILRIDPVKAAKLTADLQQNRLEGYADLVIVAANYGVNLPASLVVCEPASALAGIASIDPEHDGAMNVNSASEDALGDLAACGVSKAEIHQISVANKSKTSFANASALRAFLAKHTPATARVCHGLNFKFTSR